MAVELFNNASCSAVVTTALNSTDAAGTVDTVTVTTTGSWAVAASGVSQFRVCDKNDANGPDNPEIMVVTASANGSSVSWTLTRGAEGSTISAHAGGWTAVPAPTAGALANAPMTVLGSNNRLWVPPQPLTSGQTVISSAASPNTSFNGIQSSNMYPIPVVFARSFTGYIGFRINSAGSSDSVVTAAVWNTNSDGTSRPGTNLAAFSSSVGTATGFFWDTVAHDFVGGVTYWMALYCTATTAPTANTCWPQEKLTVDTATGWADNVKMYTNSWLYNQSSGDLSNTYPSTGAIFNALAIPMFQVA